MIANQPSTIDEIKVETETGPAAEVVGGAIDFVVDDTFVVSSPGRLTHPSSMALMDSSLCDAQTVLQNVYRDSMAADANTAETDERQTSVDGTDDQSICLDTLVDTEEEQVVPSRIPTNEKQKRFQMMANLSRSIAAPLALFNRDEDHLHKSSERRRSSEEAFQRKSIENMDTLLDLSNDF